MGVKVTQLRDIPRMLASLEVTSPVPVPTAPKREIDEDDNVACTIDLGGVRIECEITAAEYLQIAHGVPLQDPKITEPF